MELIENLLQFLAAFSGAVLSGIAYWKSRRQTHFLLLFCFYGCFVLGALYWTLYLLLFDTTPRVFYVSEFGWIASVIFLRILQAALASPEERAFRCREAWLSPLAGVPLRMGVHEFYQVNTPAAEVLYAKAREYAGLKPDDFLLDLYCGMGTIGLSMLADCKRLVGVEVVPQAVEGAKETAARLEKLRWWDWPEAQVRRAIPLLQAGDLDALEKLV